ncbi:MAG: DNA gyrase inhibitor YacG [Phycisphaeraceae bacterium]|nr:DNA gyrase inhibitor YacG [Phycisphaeraceae bacterium]
MCQQYIVNNVSSLPFCSDRCKLIDLGKWLKGDYAISRPIEQSDLEQSD